MYDEKTNAYYLHYFSQKQPDLNWENPKLRQEMYDILSFWFDKGVDGFRMDVIPFISKDVSFPPIPAKYNGSFGDYYAQGPFLHNYLKEMNQEVLSKYNIVSVAEGVGVKTEDVQLFVDPDRKELDMLYYFEGMGIGFTPDGFKEPHPDGYSLLEFKQVYTKWDKAFEKGWGTIYLGNHDQPRMLTRWGNDLPEFRELSAKMLHTFLLTMRATPFIYHGDEIGMANIKFDDINDYRDIESINMHHYLTNNGGDIPRFLSAQKITARDNGRTPFQWDDSQNAGFTNGKPWLKVNPNFKEVNVKNQENDKESILSYFKTLIDFRKKYKTLIYGEYQLQDAVNKSIYAYSRKDDDGLFLVLLNFTSVDAEYNIDFDINNAELILSNYLDSNLRNILKAYQACIYKF